MATYDVKQIALPGGDIANLKDGNAIHKSDTSGFVKNDGSIDQNTYQIAQEGKGLSTNDYTNEDKALIGQTLGNNTVLTTDKTPFLTRQTLNPTGFSGYVREKLIGASYAWNQLVENGDFSNGTTGWQTSQCSISASSNILTATHSQNTVAGASFYKSFAFINGHKYYFCMTAKQVSANSTNPSKIFGITLSRIGVSNYAIYNISLDTWYKVECIAESTVSSTQIIEFGVCSRANATGSCQGQAKEIQIIDLTLAFGSTIADYLYGLSNNGGITKLRDMGCPIDKYTPYGYGLYSVKTSGKKIVGFNVFDEEMEIGSLGTSGQPTTSTTALRATNHIPILPNTTYYFRCGYTTGVGMNMYEYDANKEFIRRIFNGSPNQAFTTSANAKYVRFNLSSEYGTTYRDDVCLNISDTNKNGQYEPYCGYEISLGNDELRGKFDLVNGEIVASGDVKESNGEITRVRGSVHLGDVTFSYNSTYGIFSYALPNGKTWAINTMPTLLIGTGRFELVGARALAAFADKQYSIVAATASVGFKDSGYTDPTLFKNSLNGVYLEYELATPTTEQSTPFADPMSLVGATTEEYMDERDIPCPVGAERQYMGQSEDVVEIPSSPQSDGKRKLVAETSGGKTQYYLEGEEEEDSEDISSVLHAYSGNTLSNVHARKFGKVIELAFTSTGSYETLTGLYVAHLTAYKPAKELNFTLYNAFNVPVGGVWITTTGIIYIRSTVEATLTEIKLNAMYIV